MRKRTTIVAASAIVLALLGGTTALATSSGLLGSDRDDGVGQLEPVLRTDDGPTTGPDDSQLGQPGGTEWDGNDTGDPRDDDSDSYQDDSDSHEDADDGQGDSGDDRYEQDHEDDD